MKRILSSLLFSFILVACGTDHPAIPEIENPTLASTSNLLATKTPTAAYTPTALSTPSPSPKPLSTITPSPTQIITPIGTPTPELISAKTINDLNRIDSFGQGTLSVIAISPNKQTLVAAGSTGIWQYDLLTLELTEHQLGDGEWINAISWSPDSERLAVGGSKGRIYIENILEDAGFFVLDDKMESIVQLNWSPDGNLLAAVWSDNSIDIWDMTNTTKIQSLKHSNLYYVGQIDWSPDSSKLASVGGDGMLQIWDVDNGNKIFSFEGKVEEVVGEGWLPNGLRSVSWSPDGQWIAMGHESGTVLIVNMDEKSEVLELHNHNSNVEGLQWSADSTQLLSASWDGSIQLLDINNHNTSIFESQQGGIGGIIFLSIEQQVISWGADGSVALWDLSNPENRKILVQYSPPFRSVDWSPKGSELAIGGDDSKIRIIDAENGQNIHLLEGHDGPIYALAWSPDGTMLASGDLSGTVNIWDPVSGEIILVLGGESVSGLTWSPDGNKLAVANYSGDVTAWSISEGEELWSKRANTPLSIAWSPNDDKVIVGTFGRVLDVLDSANGDLLYSRDEQPSGGVYSVAWNPDGSKFVSGGVDTIYLWNSDTGKLLHYLRGHEEGHFNVIKSVAYSPDGKLLVSGAYDGTIHLWNTSTGKSIKTLTAQLGKVEGVTWSPDGSKFASVGNDGIIRIWGLNTAPEIESQITDNNILDDSDFPLPIPSGEPDSIWNQLPIMPQAIAGDEDDTGYYFTIEATVNDIQNFYDLEMDKLGWSYLGSGELEEGKLLQIFHLFQQDDEMASIAIYSLDDNLSYVVLAKYSVNG